MDREAGRVGIEGVIVDDIIIRENNGFYIPLLGLRNIM